MQILLRMMTPSDERFVAASWHSSFWKNSANRSMGWDVYSKGQDLRVQRLLLKHSAHIAYLEEVPDEILGWCCHDYNTAVHYVYVKGTYRKQGIGKGLVPSAMKYYTHATDTVGGRFMKKLGLEFNPYAMES